MARERVHRTGRGAKHPTLQDMDGGRNGTHQGRPELVEEQNLDYWQMRERWAELGRRVCELRDRAKRDGVLLETLPGARSLIESFKALGRRLDRRTR